MNVSFRWRAPSTGEVHEIEIDASRGALTQRVWADAFRVEDRIWAAGSPFAPSHLVLVSTNYTHTGGSIRDAHENWERLVHLECPLFLRLAIMEAAYGHPDSVTDQGTDQGTVCAFVTGQDTVPAEACTELGS